jgi:aldehyde:ferredoxin oxidoreductase
MPTSRKLALIDLTSRRFQSEEISLEDRLRFLGGRGMNMLLLAKRFKRGIDPLGPENPLLFGSGFLGGSLNFGNRMSISAISPETGYLGDANMGGDFGGELAFTGFSHLAIEGQSATPVYLWLHNDEVEFRDARPLIGLDTVETQRTVREELGDERAQVACIGVAGENRVRFAGVRTGLKNSAARTGLGAVMGSKKLKAVAIRGTKDVKIVDPEGLLAYYKELLAALTRSKWIEALGRHGTPLMIEAANDLGLLAVRNHQSTSVGDLASSFVSDNLDPYSRGMVACWGCPVHCRNRLTITDQIMGEGPEYGSMGGMGWKIGILNLDQILLLVELCNRYGLDAISTGAYIAWAMELYQEGLLKKETIGFPLEWGDSEAVEKIIHLIAKREGFGNILADGFFAAERLGTEAKQYLLQVKNLPFEITDERATKSFALGMATSSRGACHMRSRPSLDVLHLPAPLLEKIYGGPVDPDFTSYVGKGRMVWWHELLNAVSDSLGICRFVALFSSPHAPQYKEFSRLIHLSCGLDISEEDLKTAGERICTLERRMLNLFGLDRNHDALPSRYFEPIGDGPAKGHRIDGEEFDRMLTEYYSLHGWEPDGIPAESRLRELGILL